MTRLGYIAAAATIAVAAAAFLPSACAQALGAPDAAPPTGAVGGIRSPASGTLDLLLGASDTGWGLANAEASLDGTSAFLRLGQGACPERPAPGGAEPPPGACPESVSGVSIPLDTRAVPDGEHRLRVKVTDGAGNAATLLDRQIVVRNAPPKNAGTIATVTVGVGGGEGESGHGKGKGCEKGKACERGKGGEKGKGLALKRKVCHKPRLAMHLARKPLWHTHPHHVPVLHYRRPYPYRGRLTCLVSKHRRRAAPEGLKVGVYYRVWRLSFKRPWGPVKKLNRGAIRTRKGGRLALKLAFASGRTLIFRYRDPGHRLAKAKLRLAVPPRSRRPPWGPR